MEEEVRAKGESSHIIHTPQLEFFCRFVCCDFFLRSSFFFFLKCVVLPVSRSTFYDLVFEDRIIATFNAIGHSGEALKTARTASPYSKGPERTPGHPPMRLPDWRQEPGQGPCSRRYHGVARLKCLSCAVNLLQVEDSVACMGQNRDQYHTALGKPHQTPHNTFRDWSWWLDIRRGTEPLVCA
jgi:hypothetical protein